MVPAGNKSKRLSSANHTTKTIHHHHHLQYHHQYVTGFWHIRTKSSCHMMDYGKIKKFSDEIRGFVWLKLIDWYRLANIDWLADTNCIDDLTCWPQSVRTKTPCEDLVNKDSNFADFVRFRPHTYARTQQSLPPLMGGNTTVLLRANPFPEQAVLSWNMCFKKGQTFSTYVKVYET